jgi:peptidoglycan/LPS O-acetylase OafA/YrhL
LSLQPAQDPGDEVTDMTNRLPKRSPHLADLADRRTDNNFDFLRLVLATLVILSHSWSLLLGGLEYEPLKRMSHGQLDSGGMAVNAFFILSGFLITQSWLRASGWVDFLTRRVLRIYPGFLAAAIISALVAAPLLEPDPGSYWRSLQWPTFLMGLADLRLQIPQTALVNGSFWSIRFEFLCYFAVIALGLSGLLGRRVLTLGALMLSLAALAAQETFGVRIRGDRLAWLLGEASCWPKVSANFLAGVVFYLYRDRVVLSSRGAWTAAAALAAATFQPWARILPVGFPVLGGYLLLHAGYLKVSWMHDWARRRDLSYGMYLYSYPLQRLVVRWFAPSLGTPTIVVTPILILLASLPMALACALASWYVVESPAMRVRRPLAAWLDRRFAASLGAAAARPHRARRPRMASHPTKEGSVSNHLAVEGGPASRH